MYLGSFELDDRLSERYRPDINIIDITWRHRLFPRTAAESLILRHLFYVGGYFNFMFSCALKSNFQGMSHTMIVLTKFRFLQIFKYLCLRINHLDNSSLQFNQSRKLTNKRSAEENPIRTKVLGFFESKIYLRHFLTMPEKIQY